MRSRHLDYVVSVRVSQEDWIRIADLHDRMERVAKRDIPQGDVLREALRLGMRALDPGPGKML